MIWLFRVTVLAIICIGFSWQARSQSLSTGSLQCNYLVNPTAVEPSDIRLSWQLSGDGRNVWQSGYRILMATSPTLLQPAQADVWDSGFRIGGQTLSIPYGGPALAPFTTVYWKVIVADQNKVNSTQNEVAHFTTACDIETQWSAQFIGFDQAITDTAVLPKSWGNGKKKLKQYRPLPSTYLRKEFVLDSLPKKAFLIATAFGAYEIYVNGERASQSLLAPAWTDYKQRLYYETIDVSSLLREGSNCIAAILADGWFAGNIADRGQHYYGDRPRLAAQLFMNSAGGTRTITTDSSWRVGYGPLREADMQGGCTYDARLEMKGWNTSTFNDNTWHRPNVGSIYSPLLQPNPAPPVREVTRKVPLSVSPSGADEFLVDMGQNFSGVIRLRLQGERGDSVIIRHAEALNTDGSLYTRNLRTARATDTYVCADEMEHWWQPSFTYHGFRYATVSGVKNLKPADVVGVVMSSDLPRTGSFECADSTLNKLYRNIWWSQLSNFMDVPTDCPQRDERMGWTGDAQLFMPTAAYNADVAAFFKKWMVDMSDAQYPDGRVPSTAPKVYKRVAAGWGDAAVICPLTQFMFYADTAALAKAFPTMLGWMNYLELNAENYLSTVGSFGDWQNVDCEMPVQLFSTAYFKHSADMMQACATVLNEPEIAQGFKRLSSEIARAFCDSFLQGDSVLETQSASAYLMAFHFRLLNEEQMAALKPVLLRKLRNEQLTLGIHGARYLLPVLTNLGEWELAYELLVSQQYPSWGYQINLGATTIWERWDGYTSYDGFHADSTNSFNHFAFGAVGEWFYNGLAGLRPSSPGFRELQITPVILPQLGFARATYRSACGEFKSAWRWQADTLEYELTIPPNVSATLTLPFGLEYSITESGKDVTSVLGVSNVTIDENKWVATLSSGQYFFRCEPQKR